MVTEPKKPEDKPRKDRKIEDELDEGLDETFPASDPPAPTRPPKPTDPDKS